MIILTAILFGGCSGQPGVVGSPTPSPTQSVDGATAAAGPSDADRALKCVQKADFGGISNQARLMLVQTDLMERHIPASFSWSAQPDGDDFRVEATLTAPGYQTLVFAWRPNYRTGEATPVNDDTRFLNMVKFKTQPNTVVPLIRKAPPAAHPPTPSQP